MWFVSKKAYDKLAADLENTEWYWKKYASGLEQRVVEGEKYREELEQKNQKLIEDNLTLFQKKQEMETKLASANNEIRDLRLKITSYEARWLGKEDAAS
jgi:hypothetical protein